MKPTLALKSLATLVFMGALVASPAYAGDPGWPREIDSKGARILVYQPQVESLEKNLMKARLAISTTPKGKTDPHFGVVWIDMKVDTDRDARMVNVRSATVTKVRFPNLSPEQEKAMATLVEKELPKWDLSLSLDRVITALEVTRREQMTAEALSTTPPKILTATKPTLLVILDGPPKELAVQGTDLKRVVNTPYFLVNDTEEEAYFLAVDPHWYRAKSATGPFKSVKKPTREVLALYERQAKPNPGTEQGALPAGADVVPAILVATEPSELIVSDGPPKFESIADGELLYMSNTDSNVFVEVESQQQYVLLSGRWFRAATLEGPWEFVRADQLPEVFAGIPENSDRGEVLAHVAGTPQSEDALADAEVPQTSAINRDEATTSVVYDGKPKFKSIPNTGVEYAVNTASQVLRINDRYYVCDQAVWFVSDSPTGPWVVADSVPDEIQSIPPDSPVYNTKYVHVYGSTPDVVYVGYLPGYIGCYPYYGSVVWGTGYAYPGWYGAAYYPHPYTWGFSAHYSSYYGWGFGFGFGFGYGSYYAGYSPYYYPYYYPYGYGWWGPMGYRPYYGRYYAQANNINYGRYYSQVNNVNVNTASVHRPPGRQPRGQNNLYNKPTNAARNAGASTGRKGNPGTVARDRPNNVYAAPDGNVYRRTKDGWQRRDATGWKPATPPDRRAPGARSSNGGSSARPSTARPQTTRPSTSRPQTTKPSTVPPPRPSTARPSTVRPSTAPPPRPSTGPAPGWSPSRDQSARQRGQVRTQNYGGSSGGGGRPSGGGGRPSGGGGHSGGGGGRPSGGGGRPGGGGHHR